MRVSEKMHGHKMGQGAGCEEAEEGDMRGKLTKRQALGLKP
jgi:hypothetical protein